MKVVIIETNKFDEKFDEVFKTFDETFDELFKTLELKIVKHKGKSNVEAKALRDVYRRFIYEIRCIQDKLKDLK